MYLLKIYLISLRNLFKLICYTITFINIKLGTDLKITIIIIGILFIYGAFSTFFHDTTMVGYIGQSIGETNIYIFGYFAYINIPFLLYPLYILYINQNMRKNLDFYLGWFLAIIGLVMFEALVFELQSAGYIGSELVVFLQPFIGLAGLWFFWFMLVALSVVLLFGDDVDFANISMEFLQSPKDTQIKEKITSFFHKISHTISTHPFSSSMEADMLPVLKNIELKETQRYQTTVTPPNPSQKRASQQKSSPKRPLQKIPKEHQITKHLEEEALLNKYSKNTETPSNKKRKAPAKKKIAKSEIPPAVAMAEMDDAVINEILELENEMIDEVASHNPQVQIVSELEENSKLMNEIDKGVIAKPKNFILPKIDFLQKAPRFAKKVNEAEIDRKIKELLTKLEQFKIDGDVIRTYSGPLVTTFEFKPAANVKVSKILGLQDDLAMALRAETIRIQAPIPGRDVIGIEIPNESIETIYLREILESDVFKKSSSPLTVALGKDIVGNPFITDLKKLPHLLIAGTTGSGKSVGINAMILSLLYRNDPDQLKLMLIDPKMLEFSMYNDIPHLITPVITEPVKAISALANMVGEMERRYKLMAEARTKNIENYNEKIKRESSTEPFPFIVIIIDELADLMMNGGKDVELSIARLAQKSRACGIHLVVATQRPSVDVVTGLIKANLPSRLSYRVGSRIDSKVILDALGADSLLGRGDGLFTPPGTTGLVRIHAPWNTEDEIDKVVEFLKAQRLPEYDESYLVAGGSSSNKEESEIVLDALYEDAKSVVLTDKKTSISYLQRKLQIGYNRSANIIEQLESKGILSPPNAKGNREIV